MAYYGGFRGIFLYLDNIGVLDVLLPFVLVFAVVFAILQKANIFGRERKNINVIVSLVLALSVVIPHVTNSYPPGADVVNIMNRALPNVSIVVIGVIMALLLIGIFGGEVTWIGAPIAGWIALISFFIVIYIFGSAAGYFGARLPRWLWWINDPTNQAILLIVLVFGIIIWFITKEEGGVAQKGIGVSKLLEDFAKMFGGKK